ncbi:MAG: hypothetical protein H0W83_06180, partial [Planctomycetes bacterium]|nr:hypothetical protein [Planctomycetota bacterium]
MLVSCLCISVFYTTCGGELAQLLLLASTLAVYEAVLVALAVALLRWVGALRDGRLLLTLAVLFAVDPTFTYQRCAVDDPHWGLAVSAVVVILAGAKLALAANLLGIRVNLLALGTTLSLASVVLSSAAIPLFSAEPHSAFFQAWCSAA